MSGLVSKIRWRGRRGAPARALEVSFIDDDGYRRARAELDVEQGHSVIFCWRGVELFTDGAVDVAFAQGGVITVDITHGSAVNFAGIYMVLGARIPAHLALVFSENLTAAHAATRYHAGAMSELTVEHFTDV